LENLHLLQRTLHGSKTHSILNCSLFQCVFFVVVFTHLTFIRNVHETEISIYLIERNDILKVYPGEKIPTDGRTKFSFVFICEQLEVTESRLSLQ
jgi:magnesium-transporting ATPase (P-type)